MSAAARPVSETGPVLGDIEEKQGALQGAGQGADGDAGQYASQEDRPELDPEVARPQRQQLPEQKEQQEPAPPPPLWKRVLIIVLGQWLVLGNGLVCGLAYRWPNVAKSGGIIRAQYSILYGAVAIIFFISGLSIPRDKLVVHFYNWRLHVVVQGMSFLVAPAIMIGVVHAIIAGSSPAVIDRAVLAGFVLTGCLPTTIASNVVMTRAAGGDEAAALVEVLMGNILGPFVTPAWTTALMPHVSELIAFRSKSSGALRSMYASVFKHMGLSMLVPLAAGLTVRWIWPVPTVRIMARFYINKVSTVMLILIVWSTFSTCFATHVLQSLSASSVAFVVLFNIAFYLFLTVIAFYVSCIPHHPFKRRAARASGASRTASGGFEPKQLIAVMFCGPAKTTALGLPLLVSMWSTVDPVLQAKASVPVLLYTTEQILVAHYLVYVFRSWRRKQEARMGDDDDI